MVVALADLAVAAVVGRIRFLLAFGGQASGESGLEGGRRPASRPGSRLDGPTVPVP